MDYDKLLSRTASELKPSGIRKFFDLLGDMPDVISLTVGQPDFVTPWHIREAGIESLETGKTYYTSNSGILPLREEICAYLKRRFALSYDPKDEVLVTVGGSEAVDLCMRALIEPGDEVIIPEPCFVCYDPLVRLAGGVPVSVNTEKDAFVLTPAALRAAITPRTKLLVFPFPANPTGAVMRKEQLEDIAAVLRGTNIAVLSDEIYAELSYGNKHVSIAALDGMRERTVVASGFSKSYAMTGWRLGYVAAPRELAKVMLKIHQLAVMCAPTQSQYAAVEAMRNGDDDIAEMVEEYDRRRRYLVDNLLRLGFECFEPGGAFYVFPSIKKFGLSSDEFCQRLMREGKVALVPGTAFGECGEGYVRISYAYSLKHISAAVAGIENFLATL